MHKCLCSKLPSKKSKLRLYKVIARLIITYTCETWPKALENKIKLAERKFLRKICGPKINNITQRYEIRSNKKYKTPLKNQI